MTTSTPPTFSRRRLDATDLARVAVFAAIVAVLGLPGGLSVFGSVPITAQTLGVMLAGAILGPWLGALSMAVLLALVAVGLPLLSGGSGGIGVFVGPSAGYLFGWIAGALVIGLIVHAGGRRPVWWRTLLGMIVGGILVVYAFGVPVQSLVTRLPLDTTAALSLVFVPGDLVKAVIATAIVMTLVRAYPRAFRRTWVAPRSAVRPAETAPVTAETAAGAAKPAEPTQPAEPRVP
ncbi:biotin transporter BioY [Leifsonia shinshuensis]|uniref:biotin transporter BioY n=1 Tax=Leifsonia shinshuensis TaxID=150026 RepID=UPI002863B0E8|nr:biotin transporter BioY [Leifsonia shinshuensis]MDR6971549.1 biotin transport system substrate-specific component [Leifsonia shinshuensis]